MRRELPRDGPLLRERRGRPTDQYDSDGEMERPAAMTPSSVGALDPTHQLTTPSGRNRPFHSPHVPAAR
jgi:hypothetical protein